MLQWKTTEAHVRHMTAASPGIGLPFSHSTYFCPVAEGYLNRFGEIVEELVVLQEQQFVALVHGDSSAHQFDLLIQSANERKQSAKDAYLMHLAQHGCV
jgi:hypothetical protein